MKLRKLVKKLHKIGSLPAMAMECGSSSGSRGGWDLSDASDSDLECGSCSSPPADVPQGCLPLYVGRQRQRFVVKAEYLNHPLFRFLLDQSAEEFGFDHKGGLVILCEAAQFKHLLCVVESKDPVAQLLKVHALFMGNSGS